VYFGPSLESEMSDPFFGSWFGKKLTPEESVREWKRNLKREERTIQRAIVDIEREEAKVIKEIKAAAKKGEIPIAKNLARQLIASKKAKERLYDSKAQLNSVSLMLTHQLATIKVGGCLAKSAQVMASMNRLVRIEQIAATMQVMGREMEKAGLIEEMMAEPFEDDALEEEIEAEVDKVYKELTDGLVTVPHQSLPAPVEVADETGLVNRVSALNS